MKWGQRAGPVSAIVLILIVIFLIVCFFLFQVVASTSADDRINLRLATRQVPATIHSDMPTRRVSVPVATILCEVSAYTASVAETDAAPLITASGKRVYVGGIAADLDVLPFGSIVIIPNYNNGKPCQVVDTGSAIKGNKLDVFLWSTHEAVHFGRRHNVKVQVLYVPKKEGK